MWHSTERFVRDAKHCLCLLQSNPLTENTDRTPMLLQSACLSPAAHVLPLFPLHPSRLCLNVTDMSVSSTGCMWTAVPGPEVSSLITMSSLVESSLTKAPFSLASRVSWVWLVGIPVFRMGGSRGLEVDVKPMTKHGWPFSHFTHLQHCAGDGVKSLCSNDIISIQNVLGMFLINFEILY